MSRYRIIIVKRMHHFSCAVCFQPCLLSRDFWEVRKFIVASSGSPDQLDGTQRHMFASVSNVQDVQSHGYGRKHTQPQPPQPQQIIFMIMKIIIKIWYKYKYYQLFWEARILRSDAIYSVWDWWFRRWNITQRNVKLVKWYIIYIINNELCNSGKWRLTGLLA